MPGTLELEKKASPSLELKMSDEGNGTLEGYASVTGDVDSYDDVIQKGAYGDLEDFKASGWSGFNHDGCVGMILDAYEDEKGLFVKIGFHSDAKSQSVRTQIKERMEAGKKVGMSILYRAMEWEYEERNGKQLRILKKIDVKEAGYVLLPAAVNAQAMSAKDESGLSLAESFETVRESSAKCFEKIRDLNEETKGDLSAGRIEFVRDMAQKWAGLLEEIEKKDDAPVDDETLKSLAPSW